MRIKLPFFFCTLFILCTAPAAMAKEKNDSLFIPHKHVLKIRTVGPVLGLAFSKLDGILKVAGISYERVISKKQSFSISLDVQRRNSLSDFSFFDATTLMEKGVLLYPEYRFYPFNKSMCYPKGFHIGPSSVLGLVTEQQLYEEYYNGMLYSSTKGNLYQGFSHGIGGKFGWQCFLGKRKRLNLDVTLGMYAYRTVVFNKNDKTTFSETMHAYKKSKITFWAQSLLTLGYTIGKF